MAPLTSIPTVAGNREASVLFLIPNDPSLVGVHLYSQALLLNLMNLSASRLTATIEIVIE